MPARCELGGIGHDLSLDVCQHVVAGFLKGKLRSCDSLIESSLNFTFIFNALFDSCSYILNTCAFIAGCCIAVTMVPIR